MKKTHESSRRRGLTDRPDLLRLSPQFSLNNVWHEDWAASGEKLQDAQPTAEREVPERTGVENPGVGAWGHQETNFQISSSRRVLGNGRSSSFSVPSNRSRARSRLMSSLPTRRRTAFS